MKPYKKFFALMLVGVLLLACGACGGGMVGDDPTIRTTGQEPVSSLGEPEFTVGTGNSDPYADIIKSIIKPYEGSPEQLKHQYYALYDIDRNGIDELLWGMDVYGGIGYNSVFTVRNDIVAQSDDSFSAYRFLEQARPTLLFANGTIRYEWDIEGTSRYCYCRFEAGELVLQIVLRTANDSYYHRDPVTYNEIPITKAEYDRMRKEMEGNGPVVELEWKPLAEYGR